MNRVILCGRLTGRPKSSHTPCGIAVAEFTLRVHRDGRADVRPETAETDEIPCYAFRDVARLLTDWGERSLRVNLQGRLRSGSPPAAGRLEPLLYVLVDRAYFLDPLLDPLEPLQAADSEEPPATPSALLPTAPPLVLVRGDAAHGSH
jgi:hypothetical protein